MARTSWFDEDAAHPMVHEQVQKLESFTSALADGVVEKNELAMKRLEPKLTDDLHAQVTEVMVELTAYNVMRLLHELQAERARQVISG